MRGLLIFPILSLSSGCDGLTARQQDHQLLATMVSKQIGRYRYIPANAAFPPMILDSATGCLESLVANGDQKDGIVVRKMSVDILDTGAAKNDQKCLRLGIANVSSELVK